MFSFLAGRVASAVFALAVVATLVFLALHFVGDPVYVLAPPDASAEDLDRIRSALNLDKSLPVQFWSFVSGIASGDLGVSFVYKRPVVDLIFERLPATLELAVCALAIALVVGIPLGMYAGSFPDTVPGRAIMGFSLVGVSLPSFWIGVLLVLFFGVWAGLLPTGTRGDTVEFAGMRFSLFTWDGLRHLILPALNLALFKVALVIRLTRAGVREILPLDYIRFARAKGVTTGRLYSLHVLKNLMIPLVTILGIEFGNLIAYATVTETIFSWPGVGKLLIDSIYMVDRPVITAYALVMVGLFLSLNLMVDLAYGLLDPRVRIGAGTG